MTTYFNNLKLNEGRYNSAMELQNESVYDEIFPIIDDINSRICDEVGLTENFFKPCFYQAIFELIGMKLLDERGYSKEALESIYGGINCYALDNAEDEFEI
jgi:hypothetical protein